MVAAHIDDRLAAKKFGLQAALMTRNCWSLVHTERQNPAADGEGVVDIVATDFVDLAAQHGP